MIEKDPEVLGRLLALIAHDLRNPLSALHSNLGFLGSVLDSPDPDVRDAIADGVVSCEGLTHVIDNIDLLGQNLRGTRSVSTLPISVVPLVQDVIMRCRSLAESHSLELELVNELRDVDVEVVSNRDLLGRALSNLIRNSIQHSPSGSVVRVFLNSAGNLVRIRVVDVGSEIPDALADEVFTAAGQIAAKTSHSGRYSRGMGLFAARLAADVAGAVVSVTSAFEGYNNCFTLELQTSSEPLQDDTAD